MLCKDERGRLRVGAAIGVFDLDRAWRVDRQGCGCVGGRDAPAAIRLNVIETVKALKKTLVHRCDRWEHRHPRRLSRLDRGLVWMLLKSVSCPVRHPVRLRVISGCGRSANHGGVPARLKQPKGTGVPIIADGGIRYPR
jgi:IMP dehydrogenase